MTVLFLNFIGSDRKGKFYDIVERIVIGACRVDRQGPTLPAAENPAFRATASPAILARASR
jgi:hypothetical protein